MEKTNLKDFLHLCSYLFTFLTLGTAYRFNFVLKGKGGVISSPNYPRNYPLNASCIWTIRPPEDKQVEIIFLDFDLEKNKRCLYDFMQIREFNGPTGIFVRRISPKFCGTELPQKYISLPKGRIEIRFVSDPLSEVARGFRALWRLRSQPPTRMPPTSSSRFTDSVFPSTTSKSSAGVSSSTPLRHSSAETTKATPKIPCTTQTVYVPRRIPCPVQKTKKCRCPHDNNIGSPDIDTSRQIKATSIPTGNNAGLQHKRFHNECSNKNMALELAQKEAAHDSIRRLAITFGCLTFILLIANIILLVMFYRREKRFNLSEEITDRLTVKTSQPYTPETTYSSLPKPTLKMINGDIVIVPGSIGRMHSSRHSSRHSSLHNKDCNSYNKSTSENPRDNLMDLPINMAPPPLLLSASMSSGLEEPIYEDSTPGSSEEESDY